MGGWVEKETGEGGNDLPDDVAARLDPVVQDYEPCQCLRESSRSQRREATRGRGGHVRAMPASLAKSRKPIVSVWWI